MISLSSPSQHGCPQTRRDAQVLQSNCLGAIGGNLALVRASLISRGADGASVGRKGLGTQGHPGPPGTTQGQPGPSRATQGSLGPPANSRGALLPPRGTGREPPPSPAPALRERCAGSREWGVGCGERGPRFLVPSAGCAVLSAGCEVSDAGWVTAAG